MSKKQSSPRWTYVAAVWDIENAPVPNNKFGGLWANMETSLQKCNRNFKLKDVIAIGPLSRKPRNFPEPPMKFEKLPEVTIPCEAEPQGTSCNTYVVTSSSSTNVRPRRNTDRADLKIIIKIFSKLIHEEIEDVLLIAGDGDYGNLLRKAAKDCNLNLMLAYPAEGSRDIKQEAHYSFIWTIEGSYDDARLMINGGPAV